MKIIHIYATTTTILLLIVCNRWAEAEANVRQLKETEGLKAASLQAGYREIIEGYREIIAKLSIENTAP